MDTRDQETWRQPPRWTRREATRLLLGGALGVSAWAPIGTLRAEGRPPWGLTGLREGPHGVTLRLHLEHAPFPHREAPWEDPTVFVFIPRRARFDAARPLDVVVYFHGVKSTAARVLARHQLRRQVHRSGKDAILVVPQGPVVGKSCRFGKLERPGGLGRMLRELHRHLTSAPLSHTAAWWGLEPDAPLGQVHLAAHSGGFHAAAQCVHHGGVPVQAVYLFAALYGHSPIFADWLAADPARRLVSYHDGETTTQNTWSLVAELKHRGVPFRYVGDVREVAPEEMVRDRVLLMRTWAGHNAVPHARQALRSCLEASALRDVPELRGATWSPSAPAGGGRAEGRAPGRRQ